MQPRRAVFLDRDGVLNAAVERDGRPYPPPTLADLEIDPGAREAVDRLHEAGFLAICVTNQPDVAKGSLDPQEATAMNDFVAKTLNLDDLFVCFHDEADACACRKPRPGMLTAAAERWSISLGQSYLVGDRWRDVDAGAAAGCRTVLIERNWKERAPSSEPNARVASVLIAANWILNDAR